MTNYFNSAIRFTLIVATVNRNDELEALFQSLSQQTMQDFEVIIVDQNIDDRLAALVNRWALVLGDSASGNRRLTHVRSAPGLSRSRNAGIRQSHGEILAFPDDDCWYPPDVLQVVDQWFREHAEYGILSIGSRNKDGYVSGNRWKSAECDLSTLNIFRASVSYSFFVRLPTSDIALKFDESLGLGAGTAFSSGEDTDFLLCLMGSGIRGRFYSRIHVGHPLKGHMYPERGHRYGCGWGRVLSKHSMVGLWVSFILLDILRAVLGLLRGNRLHAETMWAHARGLIAGYRSKDNHPLAAIDNQSASQS